MSYRLKMASNNTEVADIEDKIDKLNVSKTEIAKKHDDGNIAQGFEPHLSGFETRQLYKIALNFYKGK